MHVSIEGFDGVGKTTISTLLATRLGFVFVEKPLKYLFDPDGGIKEYIRIRDYFNDISKSNSNLSASFYGLGNIYLYEKFKGQNIITDRHILSNYAWSGTEDSKDYFDILHRIIGNPDFTFILKAEKEIIKNRLKKRDSKDSDLVKIEKVKVIYDKMQDFAERHSMPFQVIDSSKSSVEEVVDQMINILKQKGLLA